MLGLGAWWGRVLRAGWSNATEAWGVGSPLAPFFEAMPLLTLEG